VETNKINHITIQQYLDGSLDEDKMHELERQALEDPFLADALEGYAHVNKPIGKHLSLLQAQLAERIAQQQETKNVLSFSWQRLSVAAAAGLLFVTATILFWIKATKTEEQLASQPKQVEVTLIPKHKEQQPAASAVIKNSDLIAQHQNKEVAPEKKEVYSDPGIAQENVPVAATETTAAPTALDEVTVIGYGTQAKRDVAASVSSITPGMAPSRTITGKVVSKHGEPLPGVLVKLKNGTEAAVTNNQGEFVLNDSVGGVLTTAYVGFKPKQVQAQAGQPVAIQLEETEASLNELAVIDNGSKLPLKNSEPGTNRAQYEGYLKDGLKQFSPTANGRLTVTFTIGRNGELTNFRVIKGLDDRTNQELIRLIQKGPAWHRGQDSTATVSLRLKK
jgi:outer membrane biosynthesis protein TonB